MKILRHASLQIAFIYTYLNSQEYLWDIERDILVKKIINLVVCRLNIYVGKERMHVSHVVIMVVMP